METTVTTKTNFYQKISNFFKFEDLKTTFKKEFIGGITTFLAMLYILSVQPSMLHNSHSIVDPTNPDANMNFGGIFIATALTAAITTFVMGLSANMPIALAPGMGLNALFTFNVANNGNNGIGYQGALIAVMISSIIFCIISSTSLRMYILESIPAGMKAAIGAGVGFFITYIGLHNIGLIADNGNAPNSYNSGIPVAQLGNLKQNWPIIVMGLSVLILIFALHFSKVPGAIAISIFIGLIFSLIIANTSNNEFIQANFAKWKGWSYNDFRGFGANIKSTFSQFTNSTIWTSPILYVSIFIFLFVEFFDASGTLYAVSRQISQLADMEYTVNKKALLVDSYGTMLGGVMGCSPITTFIESSTGVSQGARTGLSSIFVAFGFLISIALFPIFKLVTPPIAGAATIFVGTLMIRQLKEIDWIKPEISIGAFFTIIMMLITFSITNGIAFGFIFYTVVCLFTKKVSELHIITYIIDVLFIAYIVSFAFLQ